MKNIAKAFVRNSYSWCILLICWECSHEITLISLLILSKVKFFSAHQENPLHDAARQGDLDTVRRLTDEGIDVNIKDDKGVSTNNSLRKGQCCWFGFELALFAGHYSFFSCAVEKAKFLLFGFQTFSSKGRLQCRDIGSLRTFESLNLMKETACFSDWHQITNEMPTVYIIG